MTRTELLAVLAALAAAGALTELLAWWVARARAQARGGPGAGDGGGARRTAPAGEGRAATLAAGLARFARRIGVRTRPAGDLERRIAAAGLPHTVRAPDVAAAKGGAAVLAAALAAPWATSAPGRLGPVLLAAAPALGFLAPDLVLRRRAARRASAIAQDVPDVLDLLRVTTAAGLPLTRALQEVGRRHHGLLAHELARTALQLELGVPRHEALDRLTARAPVPTVSHLRAAIERSDRHGTPLAPPLAALARTARAERARRLTEQAQRAAPKIQLVVALLLVPAVMLLLGAVLTQGL